jgi:hypothetical protein
LKLGNVLRRPIDGLIAYHIANKFMEIAIIAHDGKKQTWFSFLNKK